MFWRKRFLGFLLSGIVSFGILGALIFFVPPSFQLSISGVSLSILPLFFVLLFVGLFCLGTLALKTIKHGILLGSFFVCYSIMRLNGLTHPFFLLLLFGIFLALELLFVGSKKKEQHLKRQD
jgi:hypothetical protein